MDRLRDINRYMIVIKKRHLKFVILINPSMIYTLFNNNFVRLFGIELDEESRFRER